MQGLETSQTVRESFKLPACTGDGRKGAGLQMAGDMVGHYRDALSE